MHCDRPCNASELQATASFAGGELLVPEPGSSDGFEDGLTARICRTVRIADDQAQAASGVFLVVLVAIGGYRIQKSAQANAVDKLWASLLQAPTTVLIVAGTSDFGETHERSLDAGATDRLRSPYHHISMSCALALARVAGFLEANGKAYVIKDDREVSPMDFRSRPVVLIGARK